MATEYKLSYTASEIDRKLGLISGIYIGDGDMPEDYNIQIDPNGEATIIPTKTSELKNDSGFITADDLPSVSGEDIVLYDRTTGTKYSMYILDGKLVLESLESEEV